MQRQRLRAVGSGQERPSQPKGYLRMGLAGIVLWVLGVNTRPWEALDFVFKPGPAKAARQKAPKAEPKAEARVEAKKAEPGPLPLADAGGEPVALWLAEGGQWHSVNAEGGLSRISAIEAQAQLGLPRLAGAPAAYLEKGKHRILALGLDPAQLQELLPLRSDLAAELDYIELQGRKVRLRIHGGIAAELGEDGFRAKQDRLAAVLADLRAKKKRAVNVDLRFENSAVVRLASR
jgi:hypothetical protein